MMRRSCLPRLALWLLAAVGPAATPGWSQDLLAPARLAAKKPRAKSPRLVEALEEPRVVLGKVGGVEVVALTERDRESEQEQFALEGDGGGGDVSEISLLQDRFLDSACAFPVECGGPCNIVLLRWTETLPNPLGIRVLLDGQLAGVAAGLDPALLPARSGVNFLGVEAGDHTFRIEEVGGATFAEATMTVLAAEPFKDVENITCEQGLVADDGTCQFSASWTNPGPFPDSYGVTFDGVFLGTIPGSGLGVNIAMVSPGDHCLDVFGLKQPALNLAYRGCFMETCCTLTCTTEPCPAPVDTLACQITYGPGGGDNSVRVVWTNAGVYASGINLFLDGVGLGSLAGDSRLAVFDSLSPGDHTFGIQGDCGDPTGKSATTELKLKLLEASPHQNPITPDGIRCEFTPDPDEGGPETSLTVATWTNQDPSNIIDVYLDSGGVLSYRGGIRGDSNRVQIADTTATDKIVLQFLTSLGSGCYGSPLISCNFPPPPGNRFMPGLCSGTGDRPRISDAVFGLNYLFLGGAAPPCLKACDSNGDGLANLSDMVHVLNYLFLGGPAPAGWLDADADTVPDPTCLRSQESDDCADSQESCPQ